MYMAMVQLLQYPKYSWIISVDFKMVWFLLDQQHECIKFACGTAELERSIGWRGNSLQGLTPNLVKPIFYVNLLLTLRRLNNDNLINFENRM